jgi:integrase
VPSCDGPTTWRSASAWSSTTRPSRSSCPRTTGPAATRCQFDEARRLLQATADTRLGALWRLALDTGLREGELLGLGWTHLDPDARTVTLEAQLQRINRAWVRVPPKADRSLGRLAIMAETVDALEAHRRRQAAERRPEWTFWGLIFLTEAGEPYHRRAILREFHMPPVTPPASSGGASTTCAPRRPT